MSFVSYSYMYMYLNGVPLCFFPGCSGAYCTPPRYSVNMVCRSFLQPSSDNPRALHSLCSSATVRSLNGLIPLFLFHLPVLCLGDQPMRVKGDESCMSSHHTILSLHYPHYNQHPPPPFALQSQIATQRHLLGKLASRRLLYPLGLFLPCEEADQGILNFCEAAPPKNVEMRPLKSRWHINIFMPSSLCHFFWRVEGWIM